MDLMTLTQLGEILKYSDNRSIETWCRKQGIPIIPLGKERYIDATFLENYCNEYIKKRLVGPYVETSKDSDNKWKTVNGVNPFEAGIKINTASSEIAQSFLRSLNID